MEAATSEILARAADVSLALATNGVRFAIDCGSVQPGGTFSASVPVAPGVVAGAPPPPAAAMSQSDHE